jgi:hypothetical protein
MLLAADSTAFWMLGLVATQEPQVKGPRVVTMTDGGWGAVGVLLAAASSAALTCTALLRPAVLLLLLLLLLLLWLSLWYGRGP